MVIPLLKVKVYYLLGFDIMTWKCPVCGNDNDDGVEFCIYCGTKRETSTNAQQATMPSAQTQEGSGQAPQTSTVVPPAPSETVTEAPTVSAQPTEPQQVQTTTVIPPTQEKQGVYYLVFVNTPVPSLVKQRVPLDFENFPSIAVGRSPENVIVIPDNEVSRKHAVITLEGGEVMLEDLSSTNGTYVYDGRAFQQVKGKTKVAPNSLVKLGNSTIVKLVKE